MTIWWINDLNRANHEREELAKLAEQNDWIENLTIGLGDGNLRVEFDLLLEENRYDLVLNYPVVFPDAPPQVKTRDGKKITGHQYGANGELCLEFRPDNWRTEITGAQMIESAHFLLSSENAVEQSDSEMVLDGHSISQGQATRNAFGRLVLTLQDSIALNQTKKEYVEIGMISECVGNKKLAARLVSIGKSGAPIWTSTSRISATSSRTSCYILNVESSLSFSPTVEDVIDLLAASDGASKHKQEVLDKESFCLLVPRNRVWHLFWVFARTETPNVLCYKTILDDSSAPRLPEDAKRLSNKKVGLVGCGSLGSKVSAQLARSDIGSFLLVDDDVFFEGNTVRNELTVDDVGFHKTQALRTRLLSINPALDVETRSVQLGGQESSETTVSVMKQLAECDLIVDATACPRAFNVIASVCKRNEISVVWGSIFAGGIGGLVGRAVPNQDPAPLEARHQIKLWCDEQVSEFVPQTNDPVPYERVDEDGHAAIATDSDISVIASHVSRLAFDTLARPNSSIFPFSAYAIGLEKQWIFTAPFDTRPIQYSNAETWGSESEKFDKDELLSFLKQLAPMEAESVS